MVWDEELPAFPWVIDFCKLTIWCGIWVGLLCRVLKRITMELGEKLFIYNFKTTAGKINSQHYRD